MRYAELREKALHAKELAEAASGPWVVRTYKDLSDAHRHCAFLWANETTPWIAERGLAAIYRQTAPGWFSGLPGIIEVSTDDARFIQFAREFVPMAAEYILGDGEAGLKALASIHSDAAHGAYLLCHAYAKAESRRLQEKMWLMKHGRLDDRAVESDRQWAERNSEILSDAKLREAIATEAQAAFNFVKDFAEKSQ